MKPSSATNQSYAYISARSHHDLSTRRKLDCSLTDNRSTIRLWRQAYISLAASQNFHFILKFKEELPTLNSRSFRYGTIQTPNCLDQNGN